MGDDRAVVTRLAAAFEATFGTAVERSGDYVSWRSGDFGFVMSRRSGDVWVPGSQGRTEEAVPSRVMAMFAPAERRTRVCHFRAATHGEKMLLNIVHSSVDAPFRAWAEANGAAIGDGVRIETGSTPLRLYNVEEAVIVEPDGSITTLACHVVEMRHGESDHAGIVQFGRYGDHGFPRDDHTLLRTVRTDAPLRYEQLHLAGRAGAFPHRIRVGLRTVVAVRAPEGQEVILDDGSGSSGTELARLRAVIAGMERSVETGLHAGRPLPMPRPVLEKGIEQLRAKAARLEHRLRRKSG